MKKLLALAGPLLFAVMAAAQPALHWKGFARRPSQPLENSVKTRTPGRSHWLVQFAGRPHPQQLSALESRSVRLLSYVPDFAFSISAPDSASLDGLGIAWIGGLHPDQKISAELGARLLPDSETFVVVEFYPDIDGSDERAIAGESGLRIHENPDLRGHHLLVSGSRNQVRALAEWDEVAYIFPASEELREGRPVQACAGASTTLGPVSQAVDPVGDGWAGPGHGAADLKFAFAHVTEHLPQGAAEAEILRALFEWARYVQISFTPTGNIRDNRTLTVLFASGDHGDGYPFTSTRVLAHTFYPFPLNPEPIAGDEHFNADVRWQIGTGIDLFSVALHETGHALGLGDSDRPGDVMYPYYRMHKSLTADDIAGISQLYAARESAPGASGPLALSILAAPVSTIDSSAAVSGATTGGAGNVQVTWTTGSGFSGVAQGSSQWVIPSVPLNIGDNLLTVTARDLANNQASARVTINRQPANGPPVNPPPPNPPPPNPPPPGTDHTPPSLVILSPGTNNYSTSASSLVVSGTSQDNVGVVAVTWATSNGDAGTAAGITNWVTPPIPVYIGATSIVVTAKDAAGNTSWRSLAVTRN